MKETFEVPAGIIRKYTDNSVELDTSQIDGFKILQAVESILDFEEIKTSFGIVKKIKNKYEQDNNSKLNI